MKAVAIEGQDVIVYKGTLPNSYDLHVMRTEDENGITCHSLWKPSDAQVKALLEGGHVILSVHGGQPHVSLRVQDSDAEIVDE